MHKNSDASFPHTRPHLSLMIGPATVVWKENQISMEQYQTNLLRSKIFFSFFTPTLFNSALPMLFPYFLLLGVQ